jgi:hypothetical protein
MRRRARKFGPFATKAPLKDTAGLGTPESRVGVRPLCSAFASCGAANRRVMTTILDTPVLHLNYPAFQDPCGKESSGS